MKSLDYFVLDTLANDLEDLPSILRILNSPTELGWRDQHLAPFVRDEVVPSLIGAVRRGHVEACVYDGEQRSLVSAGTGVMPSGDLTEVWFRLTTRGKVVLDTWDPPPLPGDGE